jgi:hypothetical protein
LFTLLLTCADDFGRFHATPQLVKSQCYPFDTHTLANVSKCLTELSEKECIVIYEANGKKYLYISQWKGRERAKHSKYPDPNDLESTVCQPQVDDSQVTDTFRRITNNEERITNNEYTDEFEAFWKVYPRRVNKMQAFESWKKAIAIRGRESWIRRVIFVISQSKRLRMLANHVTP